MLSQEKPSNLVELSDYTFPVYASRGTEQRAQEIALRCQKGCHFLKKVLEFEAELHLLVLAPEHWQDYTGSPMFGIPQTIDTQTVVVAGQNSELWKMIVPPLDNLPPSEAQSMRAVYGQSDESIDIASFMDLLAVHEVGHVFVDQAAGHFDFHLPRRWLVELFCNLGLHAYVASEEPMQLPHLEVFPQAFLAQGSRSFRHQELSDFEALYADMEPPNFVWYQCRLHTAAKRIYDAGGLQSLQRLYKLIVQSRENLSDEQLAPRLGSDVHPEIERVLTAWI